MKKTAENDIAVCRGSTAGAWGEFGSVAIVRG